MKVSDHHPLHVTFKTRRCGAQFPFKKIALGRVDIDNLANKIERIDENVSSSEWIKRINGDIALMRRTIKKQKQKKPWFTSALKNIRQVMMGNFQKFKTSGSATDASAYAIARSAFHKAVRLARHSNTANEIDRLIAEVREKGIKPLFRRARTVFSSATTNISEFAEFTKQLFVHDDPPTLFTPTNIDDDSILLEPINEDEVRNALKRQKSKAASTSGLSPWDLK